MSTQQHLSGKSIIVTGGGSGLGRAYVLESARQGANLVINDIDGAAARSVADEVRGIDGAAGVQVHEGSVADWDAARTAAELCVNTFGAIDGLVNNAGVLHRALPWEEEEGSLRRIVEVNVLGTLYCGIHAMRRMIDQGSGSIVNITSGTLGGISGVTTYGATKGAIASMVYGWALELTDTGVRVNGVMPNAVTGMTQDRSDWVAAHDKAPARTALDQDPEMVAPMVAYLLSDRSAALNGEILRHDGMRITAATRPSWGGGHELSEGQYLDFDDMAAIIESLYHQ